MTLCITLGQSAQAQPESVKSQYIGASVNLNRFFRLNVNTDVFVALKKQVETACTSCSTCWPYWASCPPNCANLTQTRRRVNLCLSDSRYTHIKGHCHGTMSRIGTKACSKGHCWCTTMWRTVLLQNSSQDTMKAKITSVHIKKHTATTPELAYGYLHSTYCTQHGHTLTYRQSMAITLHCPWRNVAPKLAQLGYQDVFPTCKVKKAWVRM